MNAPPRPTTIHIMDAPEGAAAEIQLNAMIASLDGFDQDATDAGDTAVTRLIARLYEAREAASEIAMRPQFPTTNNKGVSLRKR
mgnify:CR=1 FL=1